ncbi:MAG: iron ABC transporter permease [Clostridia bacterium]|nr:iron ABC transporter permease [Clostridia bacterium]
MSKRSPLQNAGGLTAGSRAVLLLLPVLAVMIALAVGRMQVSSAYIFRSVGEKFGMDAALDTQLESVLWKYRLPRILLALLVGAGLSVSGCAFQSLFANPLATPDTLGVASGACFGAALALLFGAGLLWVQGSAMLFGLLAVLLTYLAGSSKGRSPLGMMILSGIMVGSLFTALISLVKFVADTESQLPAITYWLMGSMSAANYRSLALGAPAVLIGIFVLYILRWRLNILTLSEDEARATGMNLPAMRAVTVLCATAVTAACVSMCGQVGWIGLLVPHIARMRYGNNHLALVPASVMIGSAFTVIVDTLARTLTPSELPLSILTAMIGAPFFIVLMRRSGGWRL